MLERRTRHPTMSVLVRPLACFITTLLISALSLLGLLHGSQALSLPSGAHTTEARKSTEEERAAFVLLPGKSFEQEISDGRPNRFQLTLTAGQYIRLSIGQRVVDLRIRLLSPDDYEIAALNSRLSGLTPLSYIAEAPGIYYLEISAQKENSGVGRYEVRFVEARTANEQDKMRLAAERAFADAEQLRAEWKEETLRKALVKYDAARRSWRLINERPEEASSLRGKGEVHYLLGEQQLALREFVKALAISQSAEDSWGEVEALNDIGAVFIYLGKHQEAIQHSQRALALSRTKNNQIGEAQALNNLGEVNYNYGDVKTALEFFNSALILWRALGNRRGQAGTLRNIGYVYTDRSDLEKALNYYKEALSLWRTTNDPRGQAQTINAMGVVYFMLGENQKALDMHNEAARIFRSIGDRDGEAATLNGNGEVYDSLGEKQLALEYYSRSLEIARSLGDREGELVSLGHVGRMYYSLGEHQKALEYYEQALALSREMADRRLEAYWLKDIGSVYAFRGEKQKAIRYYRDALSISRQIGDRRGEVYTLNSIGDIYAGQGEEKRAFTNYEQALSLSKTTEDKMGESITLYNISRVKQDNGNLSEARALMESALGIVESLRTKVVSQNLRASYFASIQQYYELYIDVLMQLHKQHPSEGFDAAAFDVSERARARSLLEILIENRVNIRQGVDPVLLERERVLQQELNTKAERQLQLLSGPHSSEDAESIAKEIDQISREYDVLTTQIKATSPHYAALMQPQPISLREVQQQIVDEDSLLLEYKLGARRSYLWVVNRTGITSYELPSREEIEKAARRFYELLIVRQPAPGENFEQRQARIAESDAELSQQTIVFSKIVLGPVAAQLGAKRLIVVPDGVLQYIPFDVLTLPEATDNGQRDEQLVGASAAEPVPLIINHEIVNEPSASTLALIRSETARRKTVPKAVAVLADPVFEKDDPRIDSAFRASNLSALEQHTQTEVHRALEDSGLIGDSVRIPRLFASRSEAEAIMAAAPRGEGMMAIDFEANRDTATSSEMRQYRILHFATHGVLNSRNPALSGVVLSLVDRQGIPQDGFLRLHDIYNMNLPVELIVLSACNTGLGKDIKGEGMIGLTRGFMHAGAAGVLSSLWKVDDEATSELMKHFYQGVLQENLAPATALRRAKLAMLKHKRWRSPYYWAGFVLQGEFKSKNQSEAFNRTRLSELFAISALALALSAASAYAIRRLRNRPAR